MRRALELESSSRRGERVRGKKGIIGPPRLTRYELARIIGARALQISLGAPVLVEIPPNVKDPIDIALYELELGALPIIVRRRLPDGRYQDIALRELLKKTRIKKY